MTDEVRQRLAKANRLAAQLGGLDPSAQAEMLVHQAYYAMFHAAVAVVLARRGTAPVRHSTVVSEFGRLAQTMGEEGRRHGRALNRAHDIRLLADYGVDTTILPETARDAVRAAEEFVRFCEPILA